MSVLHNQYDKEKLRQLREAEGFERRTVSFYRYVRLEAVDALRDELYQRWSELGVLGRTYLAIEGVNAQISVPLHNWDAFVGDLNARPAFAEMPLKIAVEERGLAFLKLIVRVKKRILADGLADDEIDLRDVGRHLTPEAFNAALENPDAVVVDVRNHYEHEIGYFEGAIRPDVDTFQESLPIIKDALKGHEDKPVLMYCTGGIRCEKASAYLKANGFRDVNQLHGGIIHYANQVREGKIPSKYHGKNFVFDERRGERITDEVLAQCHQCGAPCDEHVNCANDACHLLFIQCADCAASFNGCCCPECARIAALPEDEQRELRKKLAAEAAPDVYKSRLRPKAKRLRDGKNSLE